MTTQEEVKQAVERLDEMASQDTDIADCSIDDLRLVLSRLEELEKDGARLRKVIVSLDAAGNMVAADVQYSWDRKHFVPPSYLKVLHDAQEEARAALQSTHPTAPKGEVKE